ncbi:MAG: SDR family oxidoreductase, partial [Alphaproteobacteria bacterium]
SGASTRLAGELGGIGIDGSVTSPEDLARLVDATLARFGRIDAVVNNTGRHGPLLESFGLGPRPALTAARLSYDPDYAPMLLDVPDGAWHAGLDLLVLHAVRMARLVTETMVRQGKGAIVNISGMESLEPRQVYPIAPLRLALHGFTKLYADRYARHGIRMNSVLPGVIENVEPDDEPLRAIPAGRFGRLGEIAKTVAFLVSDDAGYITGQNILVDGGLNRGV